MLLVGPSGTGKTRLAKALANEAGVPFLYGSASSFVEKFVGTGAARVRSFFQAARANAPCIVFLDELEAIGSRVGTQQNNPEYCQTVSQLLTELDGFGTNRTRGKKSGKKNTGCSGKSSSEVKKSGGEVNNTSQNAINGTVIFLAATNQYQALDPALLRPGRLDRIVHIGYPDLDVRVECLKIHLRPLHAPGIKKHGGIEFNTVLRDLAGRLDGWSCAEIAHVLNDAALQAARARKPELTVEDIVAAINNSGGPRNGTHRSQYAYEAGLHRSGRPERDGDNDPPKVGGAGFFGDAPPRNANAPCNYSVGGGGGGVSREAAVLGYLVQQALRGELNLGAINSGPKDGAS